MRPVTSSLDGSLIDQSMSTEVMTAIKGPVSEPHLKGFSIIRRPAMIVCSEFMIKQKILIQLAG